ncbi:sensor domain-containing diguanylate cyclase [Acidicapsa ligni]|uniref:sensor domain-containing diguanylate cyclase n=1 Tax=Acidicapsa ligni TaxID=542300 RepID=UPI0021DFD1A2|nr:diguanylate cyclase [Acidicapsa ligni]
MTNNKDHTEILEAALDTLSEGIVVLDEDSRIVFWSAAASAITGHQRADLLSRPCPADLYHTDARYSIPIRTDLSHPDLSHPADGNIPATSTLDPSQHYPAQVHLRHRSGHTLPAMLHRVLLRNSLGTRLGTVLRFYPIEEVDTLPHGESAGEASASNNQSVLSVLINRLDMAWQEWSANLVPFGLLWLTVDQAAVLRTTHGRDACEAMLSIVERTLQNGLKPTETLGRWGENEFLVLSHERSQEMLDAHARLLGSLAPTADFRWWGDRIELTLSIGAAQATSYAHGESAGTETSSMATLSSLLRHAQLAMQSSIHAGGNCVTQSGGKACSQL